MRLFGLYVVVELVALVAVVSWLGFAWTLLLLMAGAMVGMWLVRREGARASLAMAEAVRDGRAAHAEVTDGALVGLAGLLILVRGVVIDGEVVPGAGPSGSAPRWPDQPRPGQPRPGQPPIIEGRIVEG